VIMRQVVTFLTAYARARRRGGLRRRSDIQRIAALGFEDLQRFVASRSPFYRRYSGAPFDAWPILSKPTWMDEFDRINTVGARLEELLPLALRAEATRDFSQSWRGHTVGLSTGTSGHRGLFIVSPRERTQWAATLLAKMLPDGLLSRERVAFIFRAGGPLYESVAALGVQFQFFDQAQPWQELATKVCRFQPTIMVAQPQVLRQLMAAPDSLKHIRVFSVAEVLDELDKARLETRFGAPVEQIYQATEGLLGTTCEAGTIHLNEPYLIVEREWLDSTRSHFVPVITDLWRRTQPVIRYRLNDILRVRHAPCPCGRAALGIEAIEGRVDDLLWLRDKSGTPVPVFSDLLTRVVIQRVPALQEYEIVELDRGRWRVGLSPLPPLSVQGDLLAGLTSLSASLGAEPPTVQIDSRVMPPSSAKRRRVRGLGATICAS
jgi:putative adenylate-forming enzyme